MVRDGLRHKRFPRESARLRAQLVEGTGLTLSQSAGSIPAAYTMKFNWLARFSGGTCNGRAIGPTKRRGLTREHQPVLSPCWSKPGSAAESSRLGRTLLILLGSLALLAVGLLSAGVKCLVLKDLVEEIIHRAPRTPIGGRMVGKTRNVPRVDVSVGEAMCDASV